ncbi:hypothetical protein [Leucobacter sp. NPDC077196]|uniref:hypothetical protein n=1 Tax=Leucobacter sp. NPDC077196 TaxID=3154959 RepID=UPI003443DE32
MTHLPAWHSLTTHLQEAPELIEGGANAGLPAYLFTALGTLVLAGTLLLWWLIRRSRR